MAYPYTQRESVVNGIQIDKVFYLWMFEESFSVKYVRFGKNWQEPTDKLFWVRWGNNLHNFNSKISKRTKKSSANA